MPDDDDGGKRYLLDRRTYLKATGLTALGGLTTSHAAAASDPETLVVDADGTVSYSFEVTGTAVPVSTTTDVDDTIDGGSVTGEVTDGLAAYHLVGDIDTVSVSGNARVDYGASVSDPTTDSRELVVTSPSSVRYEFTATGDIEQRKNGSGSADSVHVTTNDDGTSTATGATGDGYVDVYDVYGEIESFSPTSGDFSVLADGAVVSTYELTDDTPPEQSTAPVGGGDSYGDGPHPSAATTTVSTAEELRSALSTASRGDVVFVAGDAELTLGEPALRVPAGVTLASTRGVDGAPGALLRASDEAWPMAVVEDEARLTGLRLAGPDPTFVQYDSDALNMGLDVLGRGVEIDNCEIFGFAYTAVRCGADTTVHHSRLHHNAMDGLGYAVSCRDGHPRIEYNDMNYNGHGVAATGTGGFTVAYNRFGPETLGRVIDVQRPSRTGVEIHHNTVEAVTRVHEDTTPESVAIRGAPEDEVVIRDNWFYNDSAPKFEPAGWDGTAITQVHTDSWDNVQFLDNHYGSEEPAPGTGHPR